MNGNPGAARTGAGTVIAAPLDGIRVLELGSTVAGPFCGRLLADFGADVVKIEGLHGDLVRSMGRHHQGKSLYAASIFRNKDMVSIDLHSVKGREIVARLAARSDVLVENFRPGRMEVWGLGYEELSLANPGLVMARISGYGQDGPYSGRGGYGVISEAVGGLRHITGDADRPPSRVATSLTDYLSGLYAAFGIVLALTARSRTGRGQVVDTALYEAAFSFMEPWVAPFEKLGHVATRSGSSLPGSVPNNLYPTADGEYIHITAVSDGLFAALSNLIDAGALARDDRFASAIDRSRNQAALDEVIAAWTSTHPLKELERLLESARIPATRIFTMRDIFDDPHFEHRGAIVAATDDDLGTVTMPGVVPRLSGTPGEIHHAGHRIGQDTFRVLTDALGLTIEEFDALVDSGVVRSDAGSGRGTTS